MISRGIKIKNYTQPQLKKSFEQYALAYLCFLLRGGLGGQLVGSLKIVKKMGSNFLNITVDTAKFLSNRSTLSRKSLGKFAISSHFFIFLKNSNRLQHHAISMTQQQKWHLSVNTMRKTSTHLNWQERMSLVSDTQFPSILPLPTVGTTTVFRQATYSAHASQCIGLPWNTSDVLELCANPGVCKCMIAPPLKWQVMISYANSAKYSIFIFLRLRPPRKHL